MRFLGLCGPISPETTYLRNYPHPIGPVMPWPRETIRDVAERNGFHIADLLGSSKADALVRVRAQAVHRLRDRGMSTKVIGRLMSRDHTTIVHMLQTRNADGSRRFPWGAIVRNAHKGVRI